MTFPIQITFHHMGPLEALERAINEKAEKLEISHPSITQLHVAGDLRDAPQREGA